MTELLGEKELRQLGKINLSEAMLLSSKKKILAELRRMYTEAGLDYLDNNKARIIKALQQGADVNGIMKITDEILTISRAERTEEHAELLGQRKNFLQKMDRWFTDLRAAMASNIDVLEGQILQGTEDEVRWTEDDEAAEGPREYTTLPSADQVAGTTSASSSSTSAGLSERPRRTIRPVLTLVGEAGYDGSRPPASKRSRKVAEGPTVPVDLYCWVRQEANLTAQDYSDYSAAVKTIARISFKTNETKKDWTREWTEVFDFSEEYPELPGGMLQIQLTNPKVSNYTPRYTTSFTQVQPPGSVQAEVVPTPAVGEAAVVVANEEVVVDAP
jgi:hypothetical protein